MSNSRNIWAECFSECTTCREVSVRRHYTQITSPKAKVLGVTLQGTPSKRKLWPKIA